MSVADSPFDSAWRVAKAPFYHSVNTDTSDPEVANKLFQLRDELMAEGITFDAGGMVGGGRDWELDWSLQGATPDEVMARMRDAGIPFTTEMRYEEEGEEKLSNRPDTDDEGNKYDADYEDGGVIIGSVKCPECKGDAMVIRENDEVKSFTLGCNECGYTEPDYDYRFQSFDKSFTKFDQQRAEMARMQQAQQQPPYVGDDEDLNLNIGGNEGDCCQNLSARFEEIFSGTPFDNDNGFMEGFFESEESREAGAYTSGGITFEESQGAYHWWDLDCDNNIGPIEVFNELVKPELEWILENQSEMTPMVQGILNDALQAIQEYEACQRGGFGGVDFGGDFMASGDVFEDSWNIAKFDAERAGMARMVEQEQIPAEDEEVNVDLNPNGGEPDKCCLEALQLYQELTGDYTQSNPWIWSKGVEAKESGGHGGGELDCDELRGWLEWLVYDDIDSPRGKEYEAAKKVLEQWESCISEEFSGDFTASGDVFEDAWGITKFDADRAMQARTLEEQEEETAPVINLEPPLDSGDDPCCVNAKNKWIEGLREIFGMDDDKKWLTQHPSHFQSPNYDMLEVNQNIIDDYEKMSCDELIEVLRDFSGDMPGVYHRLNVTDRKPGNETPEHWLARRIIDEYDECVAETTMGSSDAVDMYRSGDSFEDGWSVAKNLNPSAGFPRKRCWLCERVKDTYGAYPELPWYPPNWNRPCDCSGGV